MKAKNINPFLIIFILAIIISGCQEQSTEEKNETVISVKTSKVEEVNHSVPIISSGVLAYKTESKLSFKTGGIIQKMYVEEGQQVKKGQLLAKLDLSEIEARVKQAELGFEKAKRDLRRIENLYHDSVATLENFQDATTALEIAESNLKITKFNMHYSIIIAPSNGTILKKMAFRNELLGSGMPVFIFAPTNEDMIVKVNLTDKEIIKVKLNDKARIFFDAYQDKEFNAEITEIASTADPYTGTYEVELQVEPDSSKLISGFIARVSIFPEQSNTLLEIPIEALVVGRGYEGDIFVLENDKIIRRKVHISRIENDKLIISKGVKAGESVITEGAHYIDENSSIEIVN